MKQLEIVSLVAGGRADFCWVPLEPDLEVMAWPAMVGGAFISVSARTASACAAALTRADWVVSLTTPKVEDLIYERAVVRPEPVLEPANGSRAPAIWPSMTARAPPIPRRAGSGTSTA